MSSCYTWKRFRIGLLDKCWLLYLENRIEQHYLIVNSFSHDKFLFSFDMFDFNIHENTKLNLIYIVDIEIWIIMDSTYFCGSM